MSRSNNQVFIQPQWKTFIVFSKKICSECQKECCVRIKMKDKKTQMTITLIAIEILRHRTYSHVYNTHTRTLIHTVKTYTHTYTFSKAKGKTKGNQNRIELKKLMMKQQQKKHNKKATYIRFFFFLLIYHLHVVVNHCFFRMKDTISLTLCVSLQERRNVHNEIKESFYTFFCFNFYFLTQNTV